jgi:hypothetical protein
MDNGQADAGAFELFRAMESLKHSEQLWHNAYQNLPHCRACRPLRPPAQVADFNDRPLARVI